MSTTSSQQGDTIPGIAHAVELEYVVAEKQAKTATKEIVAKQVNRKVKK